MISPPNRPFLAYLPKKIFPFKILWTCKFSCAMISVRWKTAKFVVDTGIFSLGSLLVQTSDVIGQNERIDRRLARFDSYTNTSTIVQHLEITKLFVLFPSGLVFYLTFERRWSFETFGCMIIQRRGQLRFRMTDIWSAKKGRMCVLLWRVRCNRCKE